jgi:hypothetical protein
LHLEAKIVCPQIKSPHLYIYIYSEIVLIKEKITQKEEGVRQLNIGCSINITVLDKTWHLGMSQINGMSQWFFLANNPRKGLPKTAILRQFDGWAAMKNTYYNCKKTLKPQHGE